MSKNKYRKIWGKYSVDPNISENWLERLNNLKLFDLVSICEGHFKEVHPYNRQPHINLRLKDEYLKYMFSHLPACEKTIQNILGLSPVCDDVYMHLTFLHEHSLPDSIIRYDRLFIEFISRFLRKEPYEESWFILWFCQTVTLIEEIDVHISGILQL
jgi:hypothetical protein